MPLDVLPERLLTPTRDESRDLYLRSYKIRAPGADTRDGTEPWIRASGVADAVVPVHANAQFIAGNVDKSQQAGDMLDLEAVSLGTSRLPASGASGYCTIDSAATLGGTIYADDECTSSNGKRYKCLVTSTYLEGAYIAIGAVDTGVGTDQEPGAVLTWTTPRPGIGPTITVATQTDGTGLTGGHAEETDAELVSRLQSLRANPPASGNDAEYQDRMAKLASLPVGGVFTYPAILGSGTIGLAFLLRPSTRGANRIPNAVQLATMLGWVEGKFPAGDTKFMITVSAEDVDVAFKVSWDSRAKGWTDAVPWPAYAATLCNVDGTVTPTATAIRVKDVPSDPQVGQTIAIFDRTNLVFRRKKILTATFVAGTQWDLVFDTALGASDTTYTPIDAQPICPWSDSLDSLVPTIVDHFDGFGPGEQVSSFWDPGTRERRSPVAPQYWPSALSNRIVDPIFQLPVVEDISLAQPTVPYAATVGTPGSTANLLRLLSIACYPQT